MIYLDPAEVRGWAEELANEKPYQWFDSKTWQAKASWEGIPRIPDSERIEAHSIAADKDHSMAKLSFIYRGSFFDGAQKTRHVMVAL
jgi:hypothetical protein